MSGLPETFGGRITNRETGVLASAAKLAPATYCTCPSAFCDGPSSVNWLDCDAVCKACHPPERRRRRPIKATDPSREGEPS